MKLTHLSVPAILALAASSTLAATGPSTTTDAYLKPLVTGVEFTSLLTVGDSVNLKPDGTPYKLVGIPDGIGVYSNDNGTFTVLLNHELGATSGIERRHGTKGAFVSEWVIRNNPVSSQHLEVLNGSDLISNVVGTAAPFNRFCSADLADVSAFFNASTNLGTTQRIFLKGEEAGSEGRAFATVATGPDKGTAYELPRLGKFSWENAVASPFAQNKTIVVGTDDSTPGQVYVYVGEKTSTGNDVERAGLTNGNLYGVNVTGGNESRSTPFADGTAFSLHNFGDVTSTTGAQLQADSVAAGTTDWLRPEDGAWDPNSPSDFYFVTTDRFNNEPAGGNAGRTRLWKMSFSDITNPTAGGSVELVIDGAQYGAQMFDNMTISKSGQILIQEDPGSTDYLARIWLYDIASGNFGAIAQFDPALFEPATAGANLLTKDEESSGIIDASEILGEGWFLLDVQAHYNIAGELVQGGQLLALYVDPSVGGNIPEPASLSLLAIGAAGLIARRRR